MRPKNPKDTERVTILLSKDLSKKLRLIQSKKIASGESHSFSKTIDEVLRKAL